MRKEVEKMKKFGLIGLMLLVILATSTASAAPSVTLNPSSVVANQTTTLTATGFGFNMSVTVTLEKDGVNFLWNNSTAWIQVSKIYFDGSAWRSSIATAGQTNESGIYTTTFNTPPVLPGTYRVCVDDTQNVNCSNLSVISPTFSAPPYGPAMAIIAVKGSGYPANENITILWQNASISLCWNGTQWVNQLCDSNTTANATGIIDTSIRVPRIKSGDYVLKIQSYRYAGYYNYTRDIQILSPIIRLNLTEGPISANVLVSGDRFSANDNVVITWENATATLLWWNSSAKDWSSTSLCPNVGTGILGNFSETITVPEIPAGNYRVCA
ncbi:MAG: IPT/TIG domain-containing protein, partial [Archaeoglobaceae archaeon]